MSLINDALRRASHASKVSPPVGTSSMAMPPPPLPPPPVRATPQFASPPPPPIASPNDLPPVPELDAEAPPASHKLQLVLSLLLVVCVIGAAAVNFWQKKRNAEVAVAKAAAGKKAIIPDANVRLSNSNAVASALAQVSTNPVLATTTTTTVATPVAVAVVQSAAPAAPVKFPTLRLQSIFFRSENPSVIINNKTLFVHDEIQGVSVADIRSSSVTLVLSGQTNILTLR